ncbi:hypothetical protein [Oleiharenicola sp. Vm1]|uniref:hypothetical protein n=1 Tax=Oleiharenicola sp. Vm1 TaxID=3398393 RepID=UPI0039F56301
MAQEYTEIQTQQSGGFLADLGNLVNSLATPAANLYTLKLQGDVLKQQAAGTMATAQAQAAAAANTQATTQANTTKWLVWGGVALVVIVVIALVFRRKG